MRSQPAYPSLLSFVEFADVRQLTTFHRHVATPIAAASGNGKRRVPRLVRGNRLLRCGDLERTAQSCSQRVHRCYLYRWGRARLRSQYKSWHSLPAESDVRVPPAAAWES